MIYQRIMTALPPHVGADDDGYWYMLCDFLKRVALQEGIPAQLIADNGLYSCEWPLRKGDMQLILRVDIPSETRRPWRYI